MSKVNIYINGMQVEADTEKTLLDNILDNGIHIPHLCHNRQLESYGGCGLCLVEIEGMRRPLRACSTKVTDGMKVTTDTEQLQKSRKAALSLILSDHSGDCKAPCYFACPTHQDVQAYVGLIANGKSREALEVIKKDNPLPASIGRVCPHPCEKKCRRANFEGAVSICTLKRFAADENKDYIPEREPDNGKRIAVVGAGPAGLSCAYFLALRGYSVEVFEAQGKAGGMLRYGIPAYRLPKSVLDEEIEVIEKLGVKFNYNKKLGRDFTVAELKEKYDAVFVAAGAWKSSSLRCENDGAQGVVGGIDLLYRVANGERPDLGKRVAVVGGGNTAIDAVRTAVRLGAENVTLIYRRTEDEMPAEKEEIRDAKDEGVNFRFLASPLKVIVENGKATGLTLQNMRLGEPDASGRRSPVAIEGDTEDVQFDTIISAVGQQVVKTDVSELSLSAKGTVIADEFTFKTSVDGVFAAGDVINKGPDIAVRAIAGGKNAARSIDCFITGKTFLPELPDYSVNGKFDPAVLGEVKEIKRAEQKLVCADVRKGNFDEAASGLTEKEALEEASRCLECGCASVYDCKLLPLMREYGSFSSGITGKKHTYKKDASHPFIVRDNGKCILCAQCVRACKEITGNENLGLFGRGFNTLPVTAFDLPLNNSRCISCGVCTDVCPTGALTMRTPTVKNTVLPFTEAHTVCTLCDRKCEFTKRSINGRTVKMTPCDLRKVCSVGRFAPVVCDNTDGAVSEAAAQDIVKSLLASTEYFNGDVHQFASLEKIKETVKNNISQK